MPRSPKRRRSRRSGRSTRRRGHRFALLRRHPFWSAALAPLVVLAGYLLFLDWRITSRFEGRRWDLPAQVYAQPLELHAGRLLGADELEQTLRRLGYRRVERPAQPGRYARHGSRIDLVSRPFGHWDGPEPARRLTVEFAGGQIRRLLGSAGEVAVVRLEPQLIGSLFASHGEDRLIVQPEEIPALLPAALIAVEDRRFASHPGIDLRAVARALLANLRAGQIEQGGSTLTQQLVKSYFLDSRRTLGRKLQEAVMALILELHFDKQDLLNAYINEVYLAQDGRRAVHGFGLASQYYFGKPLAELELHEIALLVAVVRGPSHYDPRRHADRARARRNHILELLTERGVIAPAEADRAIRAPLGVAERPPFGASYQPAFLALVRRQLGTEYERADLEEAGLRVFTTLDPPLQAATERRLAEGLALLGEDLEGAAVVSTAQDAEVVALVGGRQTHYEGFNRAVDARRPIGSLIKPVVYLAALQSGEYHLASPIDDAPVELTLEGGRRWQPRNYDGELHGTVPLVQALAESYNLATVRLGLAVGIERVAALLAALGGGEPPSVYPSLLLGAVDLTPLEVTQVYATLAGGGFRTSLRAVRSVIDADGEPLERFGLELGAVADPAAVHQLNQGLVAVLERGTGGVARLPSDLVAAGKTGTSDDLRDSWFAGFSGDYVTVVWVGRDDNEPIGLTGASGALTIWAPLMREIARAPYAPTRPPGYESVWIEYATGLAASPRCADVVQLVLPADTRLTVKPGCRLGFDRLEQRSLQWLNDVFD